MPQSSNGRCERPSFCFPLQQTSNHRVGLFREVVAWVVDGLTQLCEHVRTTRPDYRASRLAPFCGLLKHFLRSDTPQGLDCLPRCLVIVIPGQSLSEKRVDFLRSHVLILELREHQLKDSWRLHL